MKPFVQNAASESQVKEADAKVKRSREQELNDMRAILASPQGRRLVWRYLGICHVFRSNFTGNSETFFREGERNVGLRLFADMNEADPEAYLKMMKESKEMM